MGIYEEQKENTHKNDKTKFIIFAIPIANIRTIRLGLGKQHENQKLFINNSHLIDIPTECKTDQAGQIYIQSTGRKHIHSDMRR